MRARRGVHSPSTVHLHTSLAHYHHVFEHASVKLDIDAWPASHVRSVLLLWRSVLSHGLPVCHAKANVAVDVTAYLSCHN